MAELPLPRPVRDYGAFIVFIVGGHLYAWYMLFMVVPFYHPDGNIPYTTYIHYVFGVLVYINVFGNLYLMRTYDVKAVRCSTSLSRHCVVCAGNFPPRSHHCKVCDFCVVRRDHHCWFAACCVGLHNHRHYLVIIVWVLVCAIYGNIYNVDFVGHHMGGHSVGTWLCILTPHVAAVLGQFSLLQFFIAVMTFCNVFFNILVFILLQEQLTCILTGQTKFERKKRLPRVYARGTWNNLLEVLGYRWYAIWFVPGIKSNLPLDGTYSDEHLIQEDVKNK